MNSLEAYWLPVESSAKSWGLDLAPEAWDILKSYCALVLEQNARVNLTADADMDSLARRHIADGLAAAAYLRRVLKDRPRPRIVDVGTGAGFIGVAVKAAWPEAEVTLWEPLQRRFDFLNVAALRTGLKGLRVVRKSARPWKAPESGGDFDAAIERALAPLAEALSLCLPLAAPGGWAVAFQSREPDPEDDGLKKALAAGSARLVECWSYRLPRETQDRYLASFQKA